MKTVYILSLLMLSFSCSNSYEHKANSERQKQFRIFFKKFSLIDLPVEITIDFKSNLKVSSGLDFKYKEINSETSDSIFINGPGPCWSTGYMPDTSKYYTLVYGISGDVRIYHLVTFDKKYNKIDDKIILNENGCDPATPCLKCNTTIKFNKDYSIQCIDTLYQLDCDSLGRSNDIVQKTEVLEKKLSINEKGAIVQQIK
jgi:hypothetical protein